MLGPDAIAQRKLLHGNPLVVLGISVELTLAGVTFNPDPAKLVQWMAQIQEALDKKSLNCGDAAKLAGTCAKTLLTLIEQMICLLAGRLSFASQHTFKRLGRAMLVPIFMHAKRGGPLSDELVAALSWWLVILKEGICEVSQLHFVARLHTST